MSAGIDTHAYTLTHTNFCVSCGLEHRVGYSITVIGSYAGCEFPLHVLIPLITATYKVGMCLDCKRTPFIGCEH